MLASKALNEELHCWDVATGALKWIIPCYDVGQSAIAFSPDNRMLLLATLGSPLQESTKKNIGKEGAENLSYWISYITLSPDNGMPEASRPNRMIRLEVPVPVHQTYERVAAFAFSSDCKTLASGWSYGSIKIWDTTTGLLRQTIQCPEDGINAIAVSPDGSKVASGRVGKLRLWDAATGGLLKEFEWPWRHIEFLPDGLRFQSGRYLYDLTTGIVMQTFTKFDHSIIAISPDNKILAAAGHEEVELWDATMGIQEKDKSDEYGGYPLLALSLDGNTVAYAQSNTIQIRDTATGECRRIIEGYWPDVVAQQEATILPNVEKNDCRLKYTAIALAANGKLLASGSDIPSSCQIQIWDTATGECTYRKTLRHWYYTVSAIAFSQDGNSLAVGLISGAIILLDIITGTYLWERKHPAFYGPGSFAFFPDNSMLASAHYMDGRAEACKINLWHTATGSHQRTFVASIPRNLRCRSIMFSLDGRYLYIEHQYKVRLFQGIEKTLSPDANLSKAVQDQNITFTDGWITKDGRRLLWVPEEYKTGGALVYGNTVMLGHTSGITFIWLEL